MGSAYLSSWSTRPRVLSAAAMWPPRKTAAMPREPSLRASGSAEKALTSNEYKETALHMASQPHNPQPKALAALIKLAPKDILNQQVISTPSRPNHLATWLGVC